MKTLPLYNRYNTDTYLENIEGNKWLLKTKDEDGFNYMRIGFTDNSHNIIEFVDPEGGPFLSVGKIIEGKIITKIEPLVKETYKDFILTLENKKDEEILH